MEKEEEEAEEDPIPSPPSRVERGGGFGVMWGGGGVGWCEVVTSDYR